MHTYTVTLDTPEMAHAFSKDSGTKCNAVFRVRKDAGSKEAQSAPIITGDVPLRWLPPAKKQISL